MNKLLSICLLLSGKYMYIYLHDKTIGGEGGVVVGSQGLTMAERRVFFCEKFHHAYVVEGV